MKNFFKGISVPQLVAGALAAVTSFLLSAKIGIAGSVIGVAVGSIVSAVSSQLYQNILKASSEKLQDVKGVDDEHPDSDDDSQSNDADEGDGEATRGRQVSSGETTVLPAQHEGQGTSDATRVMPAAGAADATAVIQPEDDATRVIAGGLADDAHLGTHGGAGGRKARVVVSGEQTGSAAARHLTGAANNGRTRNAKRVAIIVSVVSALVAVGITAGVIMLITRGQGTDSVVRDMVGTARVTPKPTPSESQMQDDKDSQFDRPSTSPSVTASASPSASSSASASATPSSSPSSSATASPSASASSSAGTDSNSGSGSDSSSSLNGATGSNSGSSDSSGSGTTDSGAGTSGAGSSSSSSTDGSGSTAN
ncbi:hypothetical protein ACLUXI_05380 [Bifidobacterium apri]